jgi:hypothetical protein
MLTKMLHILHLRVASLCYQSAFISNFLVQYVRRLEILRLCNPLPGGYFQLSGTYGITCVNPLTPIDL